MAGLRPMQRDLQGTFRHRPISTEMPLAKGYAADKKRSADATRQALNLQDHVSRRAKERLDIAEARHRNVIAGIEMDRDVEAQRIYSKTLVHEAETLRSDMAAQDHVQLMQAETREHEASDAGHVVARSQAMDRVVSARLQATEHTRMVEAHVREAQELAEQSISSSRSSARARLSDLSVARGEIQTQQASHLQVRELDTEAVLQTLDAQSHIEVVRSEVTRQRAAMVVDLAGSRSQATSTQSQVIVKKNEVKATDQVNELNKVNHLMQSQVDCVLKDKLRDSALNLEAAHEYCHEVRRQLANENAQFKRRMRQIELETAASARSEERKVIALEADRLSEFIQAQQTVNQTVAFEISAKRADCEAEVDEVHRRLQQAEADSRQRADQILAQWVAGSEAAEQAVREIELQGRNIMETMQSDVSNKFKAFMDQHATVSEQGTMKVAELEREANKVVDATQPALEAARREDEKQAAAALAKWREARQIPEEISRKADAEIDTKAASVRAEEVELGRQTDLRIAAARAATKAAHEEELWLQAESAEAWSRIRKACFELRLVNLHDFAQGIVSGDYDAQLLEILGVAN